MNIDDVNICLTNRNIMAEKQDLNPKKVAEL